MRRKTGIGRLSLGIFCLGLFISALSGCSGRQADAGKGSITVWHWMTDRDWAFFELARRYKAQTGIQVHFELYAPSDSYSQKMRAAAQGASLPDIFGLLAEKRDFASFIKAGHILNITPHMEENEGEWKNRFFVKALAVNEFGPDNKYGVIPGIYGVPIDIMTIQMLYNKDLFRKLGFNPDKPPVTFAEFLAIGKKARNAKLLGFVSGWGEPWMIGCLANNYAFNIMGEAKVLATIRGEVAYTDPDWIRVLRLFKEMQDSGLLAGGIVTMVNKTAEQLFANGRAVFAFNGSWCVNVYKAMNPDLDYEPILPPEASKKFPVSIWGGGGSSFMVNAGSKNREEAVKFLKWLTERDQQAYLAQATLNPPANKHALTGIDPILGQFADDMERATHPNIWDLSESPRVLETFNKGIQSIIIGDKTPEQVAQETQKVKEKEMGRERNS